MKRDPSKHSISPAEGMGLSKSDILRGRTHFKRLFEGSVTSFSAAHLLLRFYTVAGNEYDCKMGFVVAKRLGTAVKRNHAKRILREAYRLHCHELRDTLSSASVAFYGALSVKTVALDFHTTEDEVIHVLNCAINDLHATFEL